MSTPMPLTEEEVVALRGLGEQVDLLEVGAEALRLSDEGLLFYRNLFDP